MGGLAILQGKSERSVEEKKATEETSEQQKRTKTRQRETRRTAAFEERQGSGIRDEGRVYEKQQERQRQNRRSESGERKLQPKGRFLIEGEKGEGNEDERII